VIDPPAGVDSGVALRLADDDGGADQGIASSVIGDD
jgi:hypothetical protein